MKGYRFYSDFASTYAKRHNKHRGSVIAIDLDDRGRPIGRMHHTGADTGEASARDTSGSLRLARRTT